MARIFEEEIFSGATVEEVAAEFAKIVERNYVKRLEFCQATSVDDREEYRYWEYRKNNEPDEVYKATEKKILTIIQNWESNKKYYLKERFFFRSKDEISITRSSGFYDDLYSGDAVKYSVCVNVEYLINIRDLIIFERIYTQGTKL